VIVGRCEYVSAASYPQGSRVYLEYMANTLSSETETMKALPLSSRKFVKLRRAHLIPYLQVDRYTRLYDLERVVAALQKLEIKTKRTAAAK
jgi:hypothetical protein